MNEITTVGVDLAKDVIVICAGDRRGRPVCSRQLSFQGFALWAANLPKATFGLEACSSAHYWARWLTERGHTAKLMAAEHVGPFRMSRGAKNDRNDAQAVLAALVQPAMRFVAVKSVEAQAMLALHTVRQGWKSERTALINRTRGLLSEFGIWLGQGSSRLLRALPGLTDNEQLPPRVRLVLRQIREQIALLDAQVSTTDAEIRIHAKHNDDVRRVQAISGVGAVTASALVATVANANDFRNGRQLAAWLGLVPRQSSSGGKERLGRITKRGDTYLRGLLTQGARSTLLAAQRRKPEKRNRLQAWMVATHDRVGYHKTLVAIANKHARMLWAILAHGEAYDPDAWTRHPLASS
jgi:transposase